jgi:hypothetical protein
MECMKVPHIYYPNILITGDPIIDVYPEKQCFGGVLNVIENISFFTDIFLKKLPLEENIKYFYPNKTSIYNCYKPLLENLSAKTVVCSDYNKGFLSCTLSRIYSDLLIVDSKHNSISRTLLKDSKIKILKKTHSDPYDWDLISYFDYIIVTNHHEHICVYDNSFNLIDVIFVQPANTINSSGAGDVFLAALAYLLHETFDNSNLPVLLKAIDTASSLATASTCTPYTSTLKDLNVHY